MVSHNIFFILIMTLFLMLNMANFGENASFLQKVFYLLPETTFFTKIPQNKSLFLTRKAFRIRWYLIFNDILIRTRDIVFISWAFSSKQQYQSAEVLLLKVSMYIYKHISKLKFCHGSLLLDILLNKC